MEFCYFGHCGVWAFAAWGRLGPNFGASGHRPSGPVGFGSTGTGTGTETDAVGSWTPAETRFDRTQSIEPLKSRNQHQWNVLPQLPTGTLSPVPGAAVACSL